MYKFINGVFFASSYLKGNLLQKSASCGFKLSVGSDRSVYFIRYSNIWLKPSARFYSRDSSSKDKPILKKEEDKLKEQKLNLTSEQIKSLFYKKVGEPLALTSQDKYYTLIQEKQKSVETKTSQDKSTQAANASISDKVNITTSLKSTTNIAAVNNNTVDVENVTREEVATAKVINTILEKEFVDNSGNFGNTAPSSKEGVDANQNSWRAIKYAIFLFGTAIVGTVVGIVVFLGSPKLDEDDDLIIDKYFEMPTILQYLFRTIDELHNINKLIKDPSREKLLPDVLQPPYYQPPYTLVLEFTDLLVHPEWTYTTGWRFKKRPGLDQFLETLYTRYEMVVYTAEMGMTVFPIIETLDKNNLISYKLVRDATKFMDGHHVKDLEKLNRDLSKVIVLDWNMESTKLQEENLFRIPRWNGNDDDTTLFDLTALLIAISEWKVEDVRTVLKYYSNFEDPLAHFKERQKMLAAQDL